MQIVVIWNIIFRFLSLSTLLKKKKQPILYTVCEEQEKKWK